MLDDSSALSPRDVRSLNRERNHERIFIRHYHPSTSENLRYTRFFFLRRELACERIVDLKADLDVAVFVETVEAVGVKGFPDFVDDITNCRLRYPGNDFWHNRFSSVKNVPSIAETIFNESVL